MASEENEDIPVTNDSLGRPLSAKNQVLTAGAAVTQVSPLSRTAQELQLTQSIGFSTGEAYLRSSQCFSRIRG